MADTALRTQWAVCGIAAAAARFVPLPLLDDVVRERATQVAVVRTFRAHGRPGPTDPLSPLWGEPPGGSRLRRRLRSGARRLLLFPVRKYTAVFGAVRGVPQDVVRVVLLARSLDRRLAAGALAEPDRLTEEATALRGAVDAALQGVDLRLLTAALTDGLSGSRGLARSAVDVLRARLGRDDDELRPDRELAEGAERVDEVMQRPEVAQLLERFDAAVDARTT